MPPRGPPPPPPGSFLERTSLLAGSGRAWPGADCAEAGDRAPPRAGRNPRLSAPSSILAAGADVVEPDGGSRRASSEPPGAHAPRLGSSSGSTSRLARKDAGSSNSLVLDILAEAVDIRATSHGSAAGAGGAQQAAQPEEPARQDRASEGWPAYLLPRVLTGGGGAGYRPGWPGWLGSPEQGVPERGPLEAASARGEPPWAGLRASASAQLGRLRLSSTATGLAQVCAAICVWRKCDIPPISEHRLCCLG